MVSGARAAEPAQKAAAHSSSGAGSDVVRLMRFEHTGLSLLGSYQRGRIPVVFIHGLWASPWSWTRMIETLEGDPACAKGINSGRTGTPRAIRSPIRLRCCAAI